MSLRKQVIKFLSGLACVAVAFMAGMRDVWPLTLAFTAFAMILAVDLWNGR